VRTLPEKQRDSDTSILRKKQEIWIGMSEKQKAEWVLDI
jgi:hypothetical protein